MRLLLTSRFAHIVLALLLLFPTVASAQSASPTPSVPYDQAKQTLDRLLTEAQRIQGQLDASQYDLDALSAKLGVNADDIVSYVRDNIAFEQYPGLLRGAKWTLIGRAGNSIDQAALLATLLAKAGYQIKIEHGKLNPQQASTLLAQMAVPRKPAPDIGNLDAIKTLMKQMARTAEVSDDELQPYLDSLGQPTSLSTSDVSSIDLDAKPIASMLNAAGVQLGGASDMASLAAEASDYFWVSYRKTLDDKWTDAHPAFKTVADAPVVAATESVDSVDAIPVADKQTIKIEPMLERVIDGKASQTSLAAALEGPAADLAGQAITFTTLSNQAYKVTNPSSPADILDKTTLFLVQFNTHAVDPNATAFDLNGTVYNLKQLSPGEFGVEPKTGEVIAGVMADAISAFGDITPTPGPPPDAKLTAVWLNITFTTPNGQQSTVRRTIVDRIGQANRDAGKWVLADANDQQAVTAALLQNISMMPNVSDIPNSYLTSQVLDRFTTLGPILRLKQRAAFFPNESADLSTSDVDAVGTAWPGFNSLFAAFALPSAGQSNIVSYRPAPAFAIYRQAIQKDPAASQGWGTLVNVDVVANPRRAFSVTNGTLANAADAALRAGIWETHSEALTDLPPGEVTSTNTMAVMKAATSQNIPLRVVKSAADLTGLNLPAEAAQNLRTDLGNGYVAIVPQSVPSGFTLTGWWRVDPKTGETLGMLSDGRGTEMSEYGFLLRAVACVGFGVWGNNGPISTAVGCALFVGGSAAGYLGASAKFGEIIGWLGVAVSAAGNKYGF